MVDESSEFHISYHVAFDEGTSNRRYWMREGRHSLVESGLLLRALSCRSSNLPDPAGRDCAQEPLPLSKKDKGLLRPIQRVLALTPRKQWVPCLRRTTVLTQRAWVDLPRAEVIPGDRTSFGAAVREETANHLRRCRDSLRSCPSVEVHACSWVLPLLIGTFFGK